MELDGAVAVITGAGSGIGAALARRFAAEGAARVVVADLDGPAAAAVATSIPGPVAVAVEVDVTDRDAVCELVARVVERDQRIDLFASNAGIAAGVGLDAPWDAWQRTVDVNLLAHVHAARAVVPVMVAQGSGYLLQTCSAAGLLTAPGDAAYAVTKHGAVGFAEWLAVHYGAAGLKVSALCPMGVDTPLLMGPLADGHRWAGAVAASGAVLSASDVAEAVIAGLREERFLILPHPEVATFWAKKAADPDRWISAVRAALIDPAT
jgi:NAD(P)-dependent dehydrogenase (short-subunit alcohol dehydrogenase family)